MGHVVMCIADTVRARFYEQNMRGAPFDLVTELAHPEGGMRNIDLVTDRPGVTSSNNNRAIAAKNDPREVEHEKFAREIATHLEKLRAKGALTELVLVMAPRMLGTVKQEMTPQLLKHIAAVIDSDVANFDDNALAGFLRGKWPVATPVFSHQPAPLRMSAPLRP